MTCWKVYRYEDTIYAPTMVVTDDGAFIEAYPVSAVSIESFPELQSLLEGLLNSTPGQAQEGDLHNPELPVSSSQPVMLDYLKLQRWKDFEKRALMYTLHRAGNKLNMHVTGRGSDGMWTVADSKSRSFELENNGLADACRAIAEELISRRPVESPRLLGVGLLPVPRAED